MQKPITFFQKLFFNFRCKITPNRGDISSVGFKNFFGTVFQFLFFQDRELLIAYGRKYNPRAYLKTMQIRFYPGETFTHIKKMRN